MLPLPKLLEMRARAIEEWSNHKEARDRLPVLLRKLINSTHDKIKAIDFPAYERGEDHGWDGMVEAQGIHPFVPDGKSRWEFSCNNEPWRKATCDYKKRTQNGGCLERTFIFVTPRNWKGKEKWEEKYRKKGEWKNVRAFDASDLEQWLEMSLPAQVWFIDQNSPEYTNVISLDSCWHFWRNVCKPPLTPSMFDHHVNEWKEHVVKWLNKTNECKPLVISADSIDEALAFLHALFSDCDADLSSFRDKIVVFRKPGVLPKITSSFSQGQLIAVVTGLDIEDEINQLNLAKTSTQQLQLKVIAIRPRSFHIDASNIVLKPLPSRPIYEFLTDLNIKHEKTTRLIRESGRSLTVLRRRLSDQNSSVRVPRWARHSKVARTLLPLALAGRWQNESVTDQKIISRLAHGRPYHQIEDDCQDLLYGDDIPIWSSKGYTGVISQIDTLFAVHSVVTSSYMNNFFEVAQEILFPASSGGRSSQVSDVLRTGICDTLLLLSVYGDDQFQKTHSTNYTTKVHQLIQDGLRPATKNNLGRHSTHLAFFAEACPELVFNILEDFIKENRVLGFAPEWIRQSLEILGWSLPHRFVCIVRLLCLLSQANDGIEKDALRECLHRLFFRSSPMCAAPIDERISALDFLEAKHPEMAWDLCVKQITRELQSAFWNCRPRWRECQPIYDTEGKLRQHAIDKAIGWPKHTRESIDFLIGNLNDIPITKWKEFWCVVRDWSQADDVAADDQVWLLEKIRHWFVVAQNNGVAPEVIDSALDALELLEPSDLVLRHVWLFRNGLIATSQTDLSNSGTNFEADERWDFVTDDEKLTPLRRKILTDIHSESGIEGLIRLASHEWPQDNLGHIQYQDTNVIGKLALEILNQEEIPSLILAAFQAPYLGEDPNPQMIRLVRAIMQNLGKEEWQETVLSLSPIVTPTIFARILEDSPFGQTTWRFLDSRTEEERSNYWEAVNPFPRPELSASELDKAIEKLIIAKRPVIALRTIYNRFDQVETERLIQLLDSIPSLPSEQYDKDCSLYNHEFILVEAFQNLNKRNNVPSSQLVQLELKHACELTRDNRNSNWNKIVIPNLEVQIAHSPQFFVTNIVGSSLSATCLNFQRNLSNSLMRLPGENETGEVPTERLVEWIREVLSLCECRGWKHDGEEWIGCILAVFPEGKDGIWPLEPVRDALGELNNSSINYIVAREREDKEQFTRNHNLFPKSRGSLHARHKKLEQKYRDWAESIQSSHPTAASILNEIACRFQQDAKYNEEDELSLRLE